MSYTNHRYTIWKCDLCGTEQRTPENSGMPVGWIDSPSAFCFVKISDHVCTECCKAIAKVQKLMETKHGNITFRTVAEYAQELYKEIGAA